MDKLLTIIIAAYNKEKEISRCLDSLIISQEQMMKVQVLIINDGSKDRTLEIIREYERLHNGFFQVIDQSNGNYGKVMNNGLMHAQGKYFRTLDADDWFDKEAFSKFLYELEQSDADMIISQRLDYLESTHEIKQIKQSFDKSVFLNKDINIELVNWNNKSIVDNLNVPHITYKTELLRKSNLRWLEGICYTDTMYDYWPLRLVKTVRFIPLSVYVYLIGTEEQSMSPKNVRKNFDHFAQVALAIGNDFIENGDDSAVIFPVQRKFITQIMNFVYSDLIYGDDNIRQIQKIHCLYCQNNSFKQIFEKKTFCKIKYLKKFVDGKLSIKFKIIRKINRILGYKIKPL